mgnify:FL=1
MDGIAFVISGPAGVGKTTICDRLIINYPDCLSRVVTVTTRKPRVGEIDGRDYHFVTKDKFEDLIQNQEFIEFAEIHNNFYGSTLKSVQELFNKGRDVLLNIDVQGASSLRNTQEKYEFLKKKIQSVFIAPANLNDLRLRLEKRGQDSKEEIENRLATAANEILYSNQFDFIISSKTKDCDYEKIAKIYREQSNLIKEKSVK